MYLYNKEREKLLFVMTVLYIIIGIGISVWRKADKQIKHTKLFYTFHKKT